EGTFREDLYYRLRVAEIVLPALRDRAEDIPLLAMAFLRESARVNEKNVTGFSPETLEVMQAHRWPGNVRALKAAVERAGVFAPGPQIQLRDLPEDVRQPEPDASTDSARPSSVDRAQTVEDAEKRLVIEALRQTGGNRTEAARR